MGVQSKLGLFCFREITQGLPWIPGGDYIRDIAMDNLDFSPWPDLETTRECMRHSSGYCSETASWDGWHSESVSYLWVVPGKGSWRERLDSRAPFEHNQTSGIHGEFQSLQRRDVVACWQGPWGECTGRSSDELVLKVWLKVHLTKCTLNKEVPTAFGERTLL